MTNFIPCLFQARYQSVVELEDLNIEGPAVGVGLRLEQMERYLHGPTPAAASRYTSSEDVVVAHQTVAQQMEAWEANSFVSNFYII